MAVDTSKLPEVLHVSDTGKTVRRDELARMTDAQKRPLWFEELDADGDPHRVFPFYDDSGVFGLGATVPPIMRRKRLYDLGWTDDSLEGARAAMFGKREPGALALTDSEVDSVPLQQRRWYVFDLVTRVGGRSTPPPKPKPRR